MGKTLVENRNIELLRNIEELQTSLREARETLDAIRNGEVDAIIVSGQAGEKVFTLSSAETPYRIILEEMSEGAVITKSDGAILYCNERFNYFIDKSIESVVGHNILDFVSEKEKPKLERLLEIGLRERISGIISFLSPRKSILYLNFSLRPLLSKINGDICIIISDITEIQEYQNHLHALVNQRTLEIEKANEQLRELIVTKNKFFNIIAHDLTNPFTGLIGASELLFENLDSLSQEQIKSLVTILKDSSLSGYSILQNLLEWSRSQTGQLKVIPEKIDLRKLIDVQIQAVFQSSTVKEIKIQSNVFYDTFIYTDRNILNTILRNLINNAIKFTPRNGLVQINASRDRTNYLISVKDNGIGIPKENLENIFRLDTTQTRSGTEHEKGTGLGLKLCKELVEKINGNISVESSENSGSEFIVSIPI